MVRLVQNLLKISYIKIYTTNTDILILRKNKKLVELKDGYNYKIIIDGARSTEVIEELSSLGCDGFVLGTRVLFGKNESNDVLMKKLRKKSY